MQATLIPTTAHFLMLVLIKLVSVLCWAFATALLLLAFYLCTDICISGSQRIQISNDCKWKWQSSFDYNGGQLVCYFKLVKSELILLSLLSSEK